MEAAPQALQRGSHLSRSERRARALTHQHALVDDEVGDRRSAETEVPQFLLTPR